MLESAVIKHSREVLGQIWILTSADQVACGHENAHIVEMAEKKPQEELENDAQKQDRQISRREVLPGTWVPVRMEGNPSAKTSLSTALEDRERGYKGIGSSKGHQDQQHTEI